MTTTLSFSPQEAWQPLPAEEWNVDAARHLLRRAGWTARPDDVERARREGLAGTLERLFPGDPPLLPKPRLVARFEESAPELQRSLQKMSGEEKLRSQRELQERGRLAIQELSQKWLQYAAQPENAVAAKWVLFLSDVYVVSAEKVRNAGLIYEHFDILARHGLGPAPALSKAVSRSPAMVIYLDLQQSQRKAPNENFARELFELFVLGEGNYTETDIKEAARAFTGYRTLPQQNGSFRYAPLQHDPTPKTVFGATGNFTGDDVIDLAYQQKAAATFLPHELAKFYLSDAPLPAEHLAALGDAWRASGFELRALARQFFGSRLFFAPEFRGNFIKSPLQFYLGLVQDLQLDVAPLPRLTLNPMRQMGQLLFYPPNVRGWVGGRNWINSATITARRQLVEALFAPLDEASLNADEQIELVAARSNGAANFTVADDALTPLAGADPAETATRLCHALLAGDVSPEAREAIRQFLATDAANPAQRQRRLRRATVTLLQSPEYQVC
ncbi:MAG TPA: DUF1800 domain-containing protein [Opitutaceae bacterium]|nr:DUF1800 domain-containing protein [Opitutaceae bacterium]